MNQFLRGALVMACVVLVMLFLRFWRATRDGLFLAFAVAFLLLGAHWLILALAQASNEVLHYFYVTRFLAFLIIAFAIGHKNWRT